MRKYYSLIDKVYALKNLYASFASVKRNKGAAGIDHQSIADFALPNKWFEEMKLFDLTKLKTGVLSDYYV